jgi:hypothetical protein
LRKAIPLTLPPNPVPKAVDKSLNKPAKAHACWLGGECLKKQQLQGSLQARPMRLHALVLRLFLLLYSRFPSLVFCQMP